MLHFHCGLKVHVMALGPVTTIHAMPHFWDSLGYECRKNVLVKLGLSGVTITTVERLVTQIFCSVLCMNESS
jgi:hypothetical protein